MGNNEEMRANGLVPRTAQVIYGNLGASSKREIRGFVNDELQRLLQRGEITKDEAKTAKQFMDNEIAGALVRRNIVEGTAQAALFNVLDGLSDAKADKLMNDAGLTISDLYVASKLAGRDYEISYTKLSKQEREMAERGEITSSELKNIQNKLNEIIKANGGAKVLNEKETKQLMKALGLSVEPKFNPGKIILSALGFYSSGDFGNALIPNGPIGAGVEMIRQSNRKAGSAANEVEAKMAELAALKAQAYENGDVYLPFMSPTEFRQHLDFEQKFMAK